MHKVRVGIYCRCSTSQHQDLSMQVTDLLNFCDSKAFKQVCIFQDHGYSGTHSRRPGLQALLQGARARDLNVIVVWKFDRFARSLKELLVMMNELDNLGVKFISLKDGVDLSTSQGRLMMHIIGAFAEFESDIIRQRVRAGISNAKRKGKRIGRVRKFDHQKIIDLRHQGLSYRDIAEQIGCYWTTVRTVLNNNRQEDPSL